MTMAVRFKGIGDNHGRLHPQLARTDITLLDAIKAEIKKMARTMDNSNTTVIYATTYRFLR